MDTANYPEILFVGQRFEWIDAGQARMYGDLGIRGRTQPVVFDIEVESLPDMPSGRIERIRLRGTSSVSRFAYDMRSHRFFVSETIRLCLSIELVPWRE